MRKSFFRALLCDALRVMPPARYANASSLRRETRLPFGNGKAEQDWTHQLLLLRETLREQVGGAAQRTGSSLRETKKYFCKRSLDLKLCESPRNVLIPLQ